MTRARGVPGAGPPGLSGWTGSGRTDRPTRAPASAVPSGTAPGAG